MEAEALSARPSVVRAVAISGAILVVWALLAARRPDLTYHFAPLLAAIGGPASLRRHGRVDAGLAAPVGIGVGLLVTAASIVLHLTGVLDGPTFWDDGPALTEAIVFAVFGAAVGTRVATRERPGLLGSLFEVS